MKGAILTVNPAVQLVDITHDIPKFSISEASYTLWKAGREFPSGTIFLTVVDPGVGSDRRAVVAWLKNGHIHVAPDNGILSDVVAELGLVEAREITNPDIMRPGAKSSTFHGRDIFGPAAAHLSAGIQPAQVGASVNDLVLFSPDYGRLVGSVIIGRIRTVDGYGNAITNITKDALAEAGWPLTGKYIVNLEGSVILAPLRTTYGEVETGYPVFVFSSGGFFEMAINQGNFADHYHIRPEVRVRLSPIQ